MWKHHQEKKFLTPHRNYPWEECRVIFFATKSFLSCCKIDLLNITKSRGQIQGWLVKASQYIFNVHAKKCLYNTFILRPSSFLEEWWDFCFFVQGIFTLTLKKQEPWSKKWMVSTRTHFFVNFHHAFLGVKCFELATPKIRSKWMFLQVVVLFFKSHST